MKHGGTRPRAGRKPGSTRFGKRIDITKSFVVSIEEHRLRAKREGRKCNPVTEMYMLAYATDHPSNVTIRGDKTIYDMIDDILCEGVTVYVRDVIKIKDEKHFARYCQRQKKLRDRGMKDLPAALEREEAE
jgi:hypothetical protein